MTTPPRSTLIVAGGAAIGASARWAIVDLTGTAGAFPWWTLLVNVLGAFGLGLLRDAPGETRLLLGVGVCGGLTTFSTFAVETARLIDSGDGVVAIISVVASVLLGGAAFFAGRLRGPTW